MDHERLTRSVVRNHGILLPALLDDLGVTPRQRQRRVATGEWRRLPGGVLTVAAVPITFDMQVHAALVAIPAAVLSHQTSARVLEMGVSDHRIHLSVERGGRTRLPGVVIHQVDLPRCDVTVRRGLRVTTRERTLVDLAAVIGVDELQRCVDDQLVAGRTTLPRLHATFGRLGGQGRPGTARMRAVLEQLDREPPTESELEAMGRSRARSPRSAA